jgi:sulfatase maturation enzyme AslB (radical SAM superfamily)
MELESVCVILTDQCNFECSYCYQDRGNQRLDFPTLARTIDFFHPFFARECVVSFYGGEPLLAFDLIQRAVEHMDRLPTEHRRKIRFSLTTNGSLLNEEILGFLAEHEFSLVLSFDGLAQDVSRKKGSFDSLASVIPRILARPRISLETNSVFSSETVGYLSESVAYLVRLGLPKLDVNFAHKPPWTSAALLRLEDEITRVGDFFLSRYDNLRDVPWADFYQEMRKAVYHCPAGQDRMALSAQGTLWGCVVFPHCVTGKYGTAGCQEYCFGDVDSFIKNPRQIYAEKIAHYCILRMDRFSTPERSCLMCDEIEHCWICPLAAGLTSGEIGRISTESCQRARISRKVRRRFLDEFGQRPRRAPEGSSV